MELFFWTISVSIQLLLKKQTYADIEKESGKNFSYYFLVDEVDDQKADISATQRKNRPQNRDFEVDKFIFNMDNYRNERDGDKKQKIYPLRFYLSGFLKQREI